MSYLFIDSTYDLTLGVLDDGLNWLSLEKHSGQKASAIIQEKSHHLLSTHELRPEALSGIITVNGPGFYTGLRLAEGFSDVFSFFGVKQFSFYTYEIPYWCGVEKGVWFTKAYRGEYFFHRWSKEASSQELISAKELEGSITQEPFFIHSPASLDTLSSQFITNAVETNELLKTHSEQIFKQVLNTTRREPFYFRAPEDEFKVNP